MSSFLLLSASFWHFCIIFDQSICIVATALLFMASSLASLNALNCAWQLCRWSWQACSSFTRSWRNVDFLYDIFLYANLIKFLWVITAFFFVIVYGGSTSCHLTYSMVSIFCVLICLIICIIYCNSLSLMLFEMPNDASFSKPSKF